MLANAWDVIVFRFVAITIAFLTGLPVGAEGFAGTNTRALNCLDILNEPFNTPMQDLYGCEDFIKGYISLQDPRVTEIAEPFLHLFNPQDHWCNGFAAYRQKIGLPTTGLWLSDLRECSCWGSMVASAGHRHRHRRRP